MTSSAKQPGIPATATLLDACFTLPRFAVFLLLLLFAAFPAVWLGTQSFFRSDYGVLAYPFVHYHRESFWNGEIPLWNPLSNCGAPFLAQWGTMVLYPGSLIYLLLPMPWSLGVFCLLHLWLGGLGMFKLAERWTQSRFAAAVAGTVFVFNGISLACLIWPNYTVALGWMPWVVLLVERAWKDGGRTVVVAALAASMQMLSGAPEIVVFTWLVLGMLLLVTSTQQSEFIFFVGDKSSDTSDQDSLPQGTEQQTKSDKCYTLPDPFAFGRFTAVILLVSLLCAAQLLPFFDLLVHSQRDPSQAVSKWALPAWGWANLLVPLFRFAMTPQGFYFQQGQEFLTSCYVGTVALALGLLAAWRVRDRRVWLLSGLAVFALLMAMGNNGPLFPLVQKVIPIVGIARYPVKFLILVSFVVSLLVAFGVKWCVERENSESGIQNPEAGTTAQWQPLLVIATLLPAVVLLVLWWVGANPLTKFDRIAETRDNAVERMVFFGLTLALLFQACRAARERTRLIAGIAALVLIAGDGLTHVKNQNPTIEAELFAPRLGRESAKLALKLGEGRVMISPEAEKQLLLSGVANWEDDFTLKRRAGWSNLNALDGFPKINGSSTLRIKEQDEVMRLIYGTNASGWIELTHFLGASHADGISDFPDLRLPLATAGQRPVFTSETETLDAFRRNDYLADVRVYLPKEARQFVHQTNLVPAKVISSEWSAHQAALEIAAEAPALVVIAQTFYHPWKAYVDDRPVPLLRANHAFQALEVPAGTHRVRLMYEDWNFRFGCVISFAALALCGGLWWRGRGMTNAQ